MFCCSRSHGNEATFGCTVSDKISFLPFLMKCLLPQLLWHYHCTSPNISPHSRKILFCICTTHISTFGCTLHGSWHNFLPQFHDNNMLSHPSTSPHVCTCDTKCLLPASSHASCRSCVPSSVSISTCDTVNSYPSSLSHMGIWWIIFRMSIIPKMLNVNVSNRLLISAIGI